MTLLARLGGFWAHSIRWKLVAVFLLISVVPMLVASHLATQLVATAFENNVRAWLYQTSRFFVANILDERRETAGVAKAMVETGSLNGLLSGQTRELPTPVSHVIDALGYDLFMITDENDKVVFSSRGGSSITRVPFDRGQTLYLYDNAGQSVLMAAGNTETTFGGHRFRILIGNFVDQSFVNNMGVLSSLTIQLFYKVDGKFKELYTSQSGSAAALPDAALARLENGSTNGYVKARPDGDNPSVAILAPIRDGSHLIGVVYCGLSPQSGLADWITRGNLFIGIFACGMLLSIVAGLIMSRLLTQPVIRLSQGVNAIAKGDFTQRVPVRGQDELGHLAMAFNSMAFQLEGLRKMEAKLRRRERLITLGEIAAGLAHEVRNPLGIIKTSAELLQNSPNLTDVELRRLGYVVDEVRRIDHLIRDFLAFAKPPQRMVDLPPAALVERVLGSCQSEIERQNVAVRVEDRTRGIMVHVDRDQMIQTCLNLVLNALQAMETVPEPAGGRPLAQSRPRLDILIASSGDDVHFVFADNGPGIPPHLIDRIFDPFVTTKDSGTGLGLARVFAVAEGHGGWIEARNNPQGGAIFEFVIPRSQRRAGNVPDDPDR